MPVLDVDPFQTVDPFACQPDLSAHTNNHDWFQPIQQQDNQPNEPDPFLPKPESTITTPAVVASPKVKKAAPKAQSSVKQVTPVDPWGTSTNSSNNGHDWAQFNDKTTDSPFETKTEWPQSTDVGIQYRVLFDYTPERPDEMAIATGDIITVSIMKIFFVELSLNGMRHEFFRKESMRQVLLMMSAVRGNPFRMSVSLI